MLKKYFIIVLSSLILASCCTQPRPKPMIGISSSRTESGRSILASAYPEAIIKGGGIPFIIPTVHTYEEAEDIVSCCSGILFSGGEDVNPAWYGEEVLNETVEIDPVRDSSDSLLVKAAIASGKPILAICRGEQLINVCLGGSLFQDIPSQVTDHIAHRGTEHKIALDKDGFLYQIWKSDSVTVNSFHHQAVKNLAGGLCAVAWAPDGIVEAYEGDNILAVQFHPERLQRTTPEWENLFTVFVERCR